MGDRCTSRVLSSRHPARATAGNKYSGSGSAYEGSDQGSARCRGSRHRPRIPTYVCSLGVRRATMTDTRFNRITCRGRAQAGVSGWPLGTGEAVGRRPGGQSTSRHRDDRRVSVAVLGEPGKAWPTSRREGLGKHRAWKVRRATSPGAGRRRTIAPRRPAPR